MRLPSKGFTLVEVLVALAILAIALAAGVRATSAVVDGTGVLQEHQLAGWVAQNRLAEMVAKGEFPDIGTAEGKESQYGREFTWQQTTSGTPNKKFRRVELKVYAGEQREYAAASLIGYIADVPPK